MKITETKLIRNPNKEYTVAKKWSGKIEYTIEYNISDYAQPTFVAARYNHWDMRELHRTATTFKTAMNFIDVWQSGG